MTVRTKLTAILLLSIILMATGTSITFGMMWQAVGRYETLIGFELANESDILLLRGDFKILVQEWRDLLLRGSDPEQFKTQSLRLETSKKKIKQDVKGILERYDHLTLENKTAVNEEIVATMKEFDTAFDSMVVQYANGLEIFKNSQFDSHAGDKAVAGVDRNPTSQLEKAVLLIGQQVEKVTSENQKNVQVTLWSAITSVMVALILSLVVSSIFIEKGIVARARRIVKELRQIAKGDFSGEIVPEGDDEFGNITESIIEVQKNIGVLVARLKEFCGTVDLSAKELTVISEENSQGVNKQKVDIESLAAAINQLTASAQEVSNNAANAARAAHEADLESVNGRQLVKETHDKINNLSDTINKAAMVINKLQENSKSIGSVLDVIRGVAEQTNLLALNAAIEAARAGEQGRGFAVVADEVRTLAQRTQKSTQEIQKMIEDLQSQTQHAVEAMAVGQEDGVKSTECSEKAALAIDKVNQAVTTINNMNAHIALAAQEQRSVVENLNSNVSNIRVISEKSFDGSKKIIVYSEGLMNLSISVKDLLLKLISK